LRTMNMTKLKIVTAVLMAVTVAGAGAVGYQGAGGRATDETGGRPTAKQPPGRNPGARGQEGPVKPPARRLLADVQDLRDAVEEARASLDIKVAGLKAAEASLRFSRAQLARIQSLFKTGAVDQRLVEEREQDVASKEGIVLTKQAEVKLAQVRLEQAQRRLTAAEPAALPKAPGQPSLQKRLEHLEKQLNTMRREIDSIKRQLRQAQDKVP